MVEHQGPRRRAICQILVDGNDISTHLYPYLISVMVRDTLEGGTDEANIELDDRNAELQIPPDHAALQVFLGWAGTGPDLFDFGRSEGGALYGFSDVVKLSNEALKEAAKFGGPGMRLVFDGYVTNCESGFGRRGGGRRMWIEAKGHNDKGKNKELQQGSMGEGKEEDGQDGKKIPLKDVMGKVFGFAGLSVAMSPEMGKIARDYWHINDSAMNFGRRIAQETGGFFKISKNKAIIVDKHGNTNATGDAMPQVDAIWAINLIGWRIKPYIGRSQYGSTAARYFDVGKGMWQAVKATVSASTPHGGTDAVANGAMAVADKATGEQENKGADGDIENKRGTGWVLLNGEPEAKAGGFVRIEGARPGVDGVYRISEAEHNYTRGVGYTTRCQVIKPEIATEDYGWVQDNPFLTEQYGPTLSEGEQWDLEQKMAQAKIQEGFTPRPGEPGAPGAPISGAQTYTAEELERIRQAANPPSPPISSPEPVAPEPAPPISGEQTYTPQELEQIRQAGNPAPPISQ